MTAQTAEKRDDFRITKRHGWYYVEGPLEIEYGGPWRYRWEAEEYADALNKRPE